MSLTIRQQAILEQMCDLEVRFKRSGRLGYRLQGDDVTTTVTSLIVKELLAKKDGARGVFLTEKGRAALNVFAV